MATLPADPATDPLPRPHVPARAVILSAAALWLAYFVLITLRGIVVDLGEFQDLLWRRAVVTVAGIAITLLTWPLLRRFDGRSSGVRIAAALVIMLPAALALAAINQQCFAPVERKIIEREAREAQAQASAAQAARPDASGGKSGGANGGAAAPPALPAPPAVRVRHDVSGNVLLEVADPPQALPAPLPPPEPPAAPAEPARPHAAKAPPPLPGANDERDDDGDDDGQTVVRAAGDVTIVRRNDGSAEVRVGNRRFATRSDHADEIAAELTDMQRELANTQREMARAAADAERERARAAAEAERERARGAADTQREAARAQAEAERERARAGSAARLTAAQARLAEISAIRWNVLRNLADSGLVAEKDVPALPPGPIGVAAQDVRERSAKIRKARASAARPPLGPSARPAAPQPIAAPVPAAVATPAPPATLRPAGDADSRQRAAAISQAVEDEGLWKQLTDVALGRYFLLIAWAALYLALGNAEMVRVVERREGEYRRAAKAAELRSLRYQVNPHFLFNTLNSLSALVMVGRNEQAERMIQTISSFYRASLAGDPTADVALADEIALQRHYLEIETVRFPERLRIEITVPPALEAAQVPGMILQPLVENSIKYAVSATTRPVTIRIAAREVAGFLLLTVADDGPGKPSGDGGTGIGLANVQSRLQARYGSAARVESGSLPAGGYTTVLTIPLSRGESAAV